MNAKPFIYSSFASSFNSIPIEPYIIFDEPLLLHIAAIYAIQFFGQLVFPKIRANRKFVITKSINANLTRRPNHLSHQCIRDSQRPKGTKCIEYMSTYGSQQSTFSSSHSHKGVLIACKKYHQFFMFTSISRRTKWSFSA